MTELREELQERLGLVRGRILEMKENIDAELAEQIPAEIRESLTAYFYAACDYLGSCFFVMDQLGEDLFREEGPRVSAWEHISAEEWRKINQMLYAPLSGDGYQEDFSNPDQAVKLGTYGETLSFLLAELYSMPQYIFDGKLFMIVTLLELFLEIYGKFCQDEAPAENRIRSMCPAMWTLPSLPQNSWLPR